jgi:hypothetical protein
VTAAWRDGDNAAKMGGAGWPQLWWVELPQKFFCCAGGMDPHSAQLESERILEIL